MNWGCEGLTFTYPGAAAPAVRDVDLSIAAGACTALLGPNGSGKSTLLRLLLGVLAPDRGRVEFDGRPITEWARPDLARRIGVVPQVEEMPFPVTVREVVAMGRYPHLGPWRAEGDRDRATIARAMERCDIAEFANRAFSTLSGGERQRARIARALAQEPSVLALDEPTMSLDVRHEMEIFELLRELGGAGVTVLIITHNLNLAARYADRLVLMDAGRIVGDGLPREVLTEPLLEPVYRWPLRVLDHPGPGPDAGAPQVVPLAGPAPDVVRDRTSPSNEASEP